MSAWTSFSEQTPSYAPGVSSFDDYGQAEVTVHVTHNAQKSVLAVLEKEAGDGMHDTTINGESVDFEAYKHLLNKLPRVSIPHIKSYINHINPPFETEVGGVARAIPTIKTLINAIAVDQEPLNRAFAGMRAAGNAIQALQRRILLSQGTIATSEKRLKVSSLAQEVRANILDISEVQNASKKYEDRLAYLSGLETLMQTIPSKAWLFNSGAQSFLLEQEVPERLLKALLFLKKHGLDADGLEEGVQKRNENAIRVAINVVVHYWWSKKDSLDKLDTKLPSLQSGMSGIDPASLSGDIGKDAAANAINDLWSVDGAPITSANYYKVIGTILTGGNDQTDVSKDIRRVLQNFTLAINNVKEDVKSLYTELIEVKKKFQDSFDPWQVELIDTIEAENEDEGLDILRGVIDNIITSSTPRTFETVSTLAPLIEDALNVWNTAWVELGVALTSTLPPLVDDLGNPMKVKWPLQDTVQISLETAAANVYSECNISKKRFVGLMRHQSFAQTFSVLAATMTKDEGMRAQPYITRNKRQKLDGVEERTRTAMWLMANKPHEMAPGPLFPKPGTFASWQKKFRD